MRFNSKFHDLFTFTKKNLISVVYGVVVYGVVVYGVVVYGVVVFNFDAP